MRLLKPLLFTAFTLLVFATTNVDAFTLSINFNKGPLGSRADNTGAGYDTFTCCAAGTYYTNDQSYEGGQAAELNNAQGREGFGRWGGVVNFPSPLVKGDEIWIRVRTYWPSGSTYDAYPHLKFLRIRTETPGGTNQGYYDLYINPSDKNNTPFKFIKEKVNKWSPVGNASDAIVFDKWETYEMYVKLDNVSVNDGGMGRALIWKNGSLLADIKDSAYLADADDIAKAFYLFTYWNVDQWKNVLKYASGGPFTLNEYVSSNGSSNNFQIINIGNNEITITDPDRNIKPDFSAGETITGLTSGNIATISETVYAEPSTDVKMYVDDIIITTQRPSTRDAQGNYMIGTEMGPQTPQPPSSVIAQ